MGKFFKNQCLKEREEVMLPEFFKMERVVTLLGAISQLGGFGNPTKEGKIDLGGLTSSEDEGKYHQLLIDMRDAYNKIDPHDPTLGNRMMEAMVGFYWFIFPREWYLKPIEVLGGNSFRRFILQLKVTEGKKEVIEKLHPVTGKVITPGSPGVEARDCRMETVVRWANIILSESDRTEGYRKLVRILRDNKIPAGIPLPEGWQDEVSAFFARHATKVTEISPAVRGPRYWGIMVVLLSIILTMSTWWRWVPIPLALLIFGVPFVPRGIRSLRNWWRR